VADFHYLATIGTVQRAIQSSTNDSKRANAAIAKTRVSVKLIEAWEPQAGAGKRDSFIHPK